MYSPSTQECELRQGEIISDITQYIYNLESDELIETPRPFCVVLTQDCDLLRDFENINEGKKPALGGIILLPVYLAEEARKDHMNSDTWKRAKKNDHDRWHVLQAIPPEADLLNIGISDMLIDFRQLFTLPSQQLWQEICAESAKRRAVLLPPYRDHLQVRAMHYLSRIALDPPHQVA